jgi:hypothetical protein
LIELPDDLLGPTGEDLVDPCPVLASGARQAAARVVRNSRAIRN